MRWLALGAPTATETAFRRQIEVDPFGLRIHAMAACLGLAMVASPTSIAEFAIVPPGLAWCIRVHRHWRASLALLAQPGFVALLAWLAWRLIALTWSPDRAQGWDELGVARFGLLTVACWPAMPYRRWFIPSLAFGFLVGNLTQVGHAVGSATGVDWLVWPRFPGRNSGWWDPVIAGSLLTGVLGLHLAAAAWGAGRWRIAGVVCSMLTAGAIVATGTRGAWLASGALIALVVGLLAFGAVRRAGSLRHAGVLVAVVVVGVLVVGFVARGPLGARVDAARAEIAGALEHADYSTDTGARIGMAFAALRALREHPIGGVGAGGYQAWTEVEFAPEHAPSLEPHAHAHNALLHELATTGLVGGAIACAFGLALFSGALRTFEGDGPPGYAHGPALALLGLALVSAFDVVHLNAQTAQLLAAVALLSANPRPRGVCS